MNKNLWQCTVAPQNGGALRLRAFGAPLRMTGP